MDKTTTPTPLAIAPLWNRIWACLLDWVIVWNIAFFSAVLFRLSDQETIAGILITLIPVGYFFHGSGPSGQTIGKKLAKIRVVRRNGSPMTWGRALLRSALTVYLLPLIHISLIVAVIDKEDQQSLQDRIAGSVVINT